MKIETIFDNGDHKWIYIGRPNEQDKRIIETNQYAIISKGEVLLMDPGGAAVFPDVLTSISSLFDVKNVKYLVCSHQDPDIVSSIPLWMAICPEAKVYCSWLWKGFLAHYGTEFIDKYVSLPDGGLDIMLGGRKISIIPAHYCHSSGNFSLFDHDAGILFSGDIGGANIDSKYPLFCEDFMKHSKVMERFHKRLMPSASALMKWVKIVRKLSPRMICPQHGSLMKDENVHEFLDWLYDLEVGVY